MAATQSSDVEGCTMSNLADEASRTDLLNRLKRAEGQLRGIQRMIEEGQPCLDIASQMAAVRKALDSTYVRMTVCFMQQELQSRLGVDKRQQGELGAVLDDVQTLLGKVR
jgi:DNA-binding FrmR family transcriptional regulator